ncbi:unnamed protein product [Angiostrongylus costaricensis]|uniref:CPSF73-100_C domain-containing protein n=1 Tax=Angiostrongylus costaricensis TaxID=334426 RepID=A0A0R3PMW0_ANGCS|nr:unnamed protein product [Angiostrongylus costaricensis]
MNQRDIRVLSLYEWKNGHNTAAGAQNFIMVGVKAMLVNQFDLEDKEGRERPNELDDDDDLKTLMEANTGTIVGELTVQ